LILCEYIYILYISIIVYNILIIDNIY